MKKVLLGLLAVSVLAMGFTPEQATSNIEVRTIAEIDLEEGIVILPEEDGINGAGKPLVLDHGRVTTDTDVSGGVAETVKIGLLPDGEDLTDANLNNLQPGMTLTVTLETRDATIGNRLVYNDGAAPHYIGHELSATISNGTTGSIAGTKYTTIAPGSSLKKVLTAYPITVPVIPTIEVKSILNADDVSNADQAGLYANTSYLVVEIAKK